MKLFQNRKSHFSAMTHRSWGKLCCLRDECVEDATFCPNRL
jgi:hypothetical protein